MLILRITSQASSLTAHRTTNIEHVSNNYIILLQRKNRSRFPLRSGVADTKTGLRAYLEENMCHDSGLISYTR